MLQQGVNNNDKQSGDRTDPCFTPQLTGKHTENWLSSLTTLIELMLENQFFIRCQNLPFTLIRKDVPVERHIRQNLKLFLGQKKQRVGFSSSRMDLRMDSCVEKMASAQEIPLLYAVWARWGKPFSKRTGLSLSRSALSRHLATTKVRVTLSAHAQRVIVVRACVYVCYHFSASVRVCNKLNLPAKSPLNDAKVWMCRFC